MAWVALGVLVVAALRPTAPSAATVAASA
jgi:hypothetical protein